MLEKMILAIAATMAFYLTFRPALPIRIGPVALGANVLHPAAQPTLVLIPGHSPKGL
ncbi:hypothetical protein [Leptolyngbya sp. 'hensonii']|uniref:hypothetical protein n=1 Tax=Leptolyngbya sp. 'hensonii' TaxID=1922337 RepID=UPI000AEC5595|nr:hypothetical protein [Leptolyngbya sp. 'hensonii']